MTKIGVYKTDVEDQSEANTILDEIRRTLPDSDPSFDLDDCDNVLRIEYKSAGKSEEKLTFIFKCLGYHFEPLP